MLNILWQLCMFHKSFNFKKLQKIERPLNMNCRKHVFSMTISFAGIVQKAIAKFGRNFVKRVEECPDLEADFQWLIKPYTPSRLNFFPITLCAFLIPSHLVWMSELWWQANSGTHANMEDVERDLQTSSRTTQYCHQNQSGALCSLRKMVDWHGGKSNQKHWCVHVLLIPSRQFLNWHMREVTFFKSNLQLHLILSRVLWSLFNENSPHTINLLYLIKAYLGQCVMDDIVGKTQKF